MKRNESQEVFSHMIAIITMRKNLALLVFVEAKIAKMPYSIAHVQGESSVVDYEVLGGVSSMFL